MKNSLLIMRKNFLIEKIDKRKVPLLTNEIVVLTGMPGSGKSTVARTMFPGYTRINLDTLKSRSREKAEIQRALSNSENIIIDNTNMTIKARQRYITIAKHNGITIRSIYVNCSLEDAISRNKLRTDKQKVPVFVVRFYHKMLQPPTVSEGFSSCEVIDTSSR